MERTPKINCPIELIEVVRKGLSRHKERITSFHCEEVHIGNFSSRAKNPYVHFSPDGIIFQASSIVTGFTVYNGILKDNIVKMYLCLKKNPYFIIQIDAPGASLIKETLEFNTPKAAKKKYCLNPNKMAKDPEAGHITFKLTEKDIEHRVRYINENYAGKLLDVTGKEGQDALFMKFTKPSAVVTISDSEPSSEDDEPLYLCETRALSQLELDGKIPETADKCTETENSEINVIPATPPTPPSSLSPPPELPIAIKFNSQQKLHASACRERIIPIQVDHDFRAKKSRRNINTVEISPQRIPESPELDDDEVYFDCEPGPSTSLPIFSPRKPPQNYFMSSMTEKNKISPTTTRERHIPIKLDSDYSSEKEKCKSKAIVSEDNREYVSQSPDFDDEEEMDTICDPKPGPSTSPSKKKLPVIDVIELDDTDDLEAEGDPEEQIIFVYPRDEQNSLNKVTISETDVKCLEPHSWLNDNIVDFWCKYFYLEKLDFVNQIRSHIFSAFFYPALVKSRKLAPKSFRDAVASWTKHVDIFEKDFIFIPLSDSNCHWVLAIICFPGLVSKNKYSSTGEKRRDSKENSSSKPKRFRLANYDEDEHFLSSGIEANDEEEDKVPCILILDSIVDEFCRAPIFQVLRAFLQQEWDSKNEKQVSFTSDSMPGFFLTVPQQKNFSDCGLYTLKFLEMFFLKGIKSFRTPLPNKSNWFSTSEAKSLREDMYKLIKCYVQLHCPESLPLIPKIDFRKSVFVSSSPERSDSAH